MSALASPYLDPAEAAKYLRMKETRLRRLAQKGLIAKRKDGAFLKFTLEDLDEYVRSTRVPATTPTREDDAVVVPAPDGEPGTGNPYKTSRRKRR